MATLALHNNHFMNTSSLHTGEWSLGYADQLPNNAEGLAARLGELGLGSDQNGDQLVSMYWAYQRINALEEELHNVRAEKDMISRQLQGVLSEVDNLEQRLLSHPSDQGFACGAQDPLTTQMRPCLQLVKHLLGTLDVQAAQLGEHHTVEQTLDLMQSQIAQVTELLQLLFKMSPDIHTAAALQQISALGHSGAVNVPTSCALPLDIPAPVSYLSSQISPLSSQMSPTETAEYFPAHFLGRANLTSNNFGLSSIGLSSTGLPSAGHSSAGPSSARLSHAGPGRAGLSHAGLGHAGLSRAGFSGAALSNVVGLSSAGLSSARLTSSGLNSAGLASTGTSGASIGTAGLSAGTVRDRWQAALRYCSRSHGNTSAAASNPAASFKRLNSITSSCSTLSGVPAMSPMSIRGASPPRLALYGMPPPGDLCSTSSQYSAGSVPGSPSASPQQPAIYIDPARLQELAGPALVLQCAWRAAWVRCKYNRLRREVFVGNLPIKEQVYAEELGALFGVAGDVETVAVMRNTTGSRGQVGLCRGFGFVRYYTMEDAYHALLMLQGVRFRSRTLRVDRATWRT